jgi:hypothetical protein
MEKLELNNEFGKMDVVGGIVFLGFIFRESSPLTDTIMIDEKQAQELAKYLVSWLNRPEELRRP